MQLSALGGALGATPSLALFDCNNDEHAFPSQSGAFMVHYTPARESNFPTDAPDSWVAICISNANSIGFTQSAPLPTNCGTGHPAMFSTDQTGLQFPLTITNGHGCSGDGFNKDLDGWALDYNESHRDLGEPEGHYDYGQQCGPTDKGITCRIRIVGNGDPAYGW